MTRLDLPLYFVRVVIAPGRLTVIDYKGDEHEYGLNPLQHEFAVERVLLARSGTGYAGHYTPPREPHPADLFWHIVKCHIPW